MAIAEVRSQENRWLVDHDKWKNVSFILKF